jgi:rubrerythrin
MKHFFLKFNHGVEIGARLAYIGHFERTKDPKIQHIIYDEEMHKIQLEIILSEYGEVPSKLIDGAFTFIGSTIRRSCKHCPIWSLDLVARLMEGFAVVNYVRLSKLYPKHRDTFGFMAMVEENHGRYFRNKK